MDIDLISRTVVDWYSCLAFSRVWFVHQRIYSVVSKKLSYHTSLLDARWTLWNPLHPFRKDQDQPEMYNWISDQRANRFPLRLDPTQSWSQWEWQIEEKERTDFQLCLAAVLDFKVRRIFENGKGSITEMNSTRLKEDADSFRIFSATNIVLLLLTLWFG